MSIREARNGWISRAPSLTDLFFPILLVAAFGRGQAWLGLLADGDTGWHIRTGDAILRTGSVPHQDLFSFSRAGQPWFAWEWLADVIFAQLHRWQGLAAVAGFSAVVLCVAALLLWVRLLRRGVGLMVAAPVVFAVVSASTIHYLARPHVFSLLLVTVLLWLLEEDQRAPSRRVWWLVPLMAAWTNLHGGFVCGIAIVGLAAVVRGIERDWRGFRRYAALTASCMAASLANPYGWQLHRHIAGYLSSSWILQNVQEFQSPHIRAENMQVFAAMLLVSVALVPLAMARKQRFEALLVLAWGFASLRSARHVPLFAIVAAPLLAGECEAWWARLSSGRSRRSAVRIFWNLSQEFAQSRRLSVWCAALGILALWMIYPRQGLMDFPAEQFPVAAVARNGQVLQSGRVLTSDQWGDYLIYRMNGRLPVFFDGRSDFYGRAVGSDYQVLLSAGRGWRDVMTRYGFEVALIPADWPLASVMEQDGLWQVVDRDERATVLVRRETRLQENRGAADCTFVGE